MTMALFQQTLKALISQAYSLFSVYHLNDAQDLDACRCPLCLSDEQHTHLKTTALAYIDHTIFMCYANLSTLQDQTPLNEFKYFLPLFLDLMIQNDNVWQLEGYFFQRMTSYTAEDWTVEELTFLQQFAEMYVQYALCDEDNVVFTPIERLLEQFHVDAFDTEKLAMLCLHHPSAYCLIDYATQIVNHGYDDFEDPEDDLYAERVKNILLPWKYDSAIRQHFIDQYHHFKAKGHLFDEGNANWVQEWIAGVQQGKY